MDREKVIKALEYCRNQSGCWSDISECPWIKECKEDVNSLKDACIDLLKEQEDLGTELTNAVELIHKKNERIEKLLKEQEEEHKRLLSWLSKFCRHIDNGDKWLTDEENLDFFRKKMKQQFGWDCD